jgi:hypothetical protein
MSIIRSQILVKRRIILFILFFILTPVVLAEEAPKYNLATTTATGTILIQPGETLKVPAIYFFNIYGNRITHVRLSLAIAPKGWDVKIEPEMHEVQVNISGTIVTASENLYVIPSKPVNEVPAVVSEGMAYITLGGVEGNIPTKIAYLNITAPPDIPLGSTYSISVKAVGSWFGGAATLAFSQERSFTFTVQTVTHSFTEEIVQPTPGKGTGVPAYVAYLVVILLALGAGYYAWRKKK